METGAARVSRVEASFTGPRYAAGMKRMAAVVVIVLLLALVVTYWWPRAEPVTVAPMSRSVPAPRETTVATQSFVAPTALPQAIEALPATPPREIAGVPVPDFTALHLKLRRTVLEERFRMLPELLAAAIHGDGWAAGEAHRLVEWCVDPGRLTASQVEARAIESAARVAALPAGPRRNIEAQAARVVREVARARAQDEACTGISQAHADAMWRAVLVMAERGNRGAQRYVALSLATRYEELVEAGVVARGSTLERKARDWLMGSARRAIRESQEALAASYCSGGLFQPDPMQCYAWQRFLFDTTRRYPGRSYADDEARVDGWAASLTPAQRAEAELLIRELLDCCLHPKR